MARIPTTPPEPNAEPPDDAQLRAAATSLGMDYDTIPADELDFIRVFAEGGLDSIEPDGDPENPLIPAPVDLDEITPAADEGATLPTDADGAGVGPGPEASVDGGDGGGGDPAAPAPTSGLPSAVPVFPEAEPTTIDLGNGMVLNAEQVQQYIAQAQSAPNQLSPDEIAYINARRQGLVAPQFVDPATGLPVQQQAPAPAQPEEWLDTNAQAAYTHIQEQLGQLSQQQRQVAEVALMQQNAAIQKGMEDGIELFKRERGIDDAQAERLLRSVNVLGILPSYANMYPGDPRSAVAASLEAVYWSTPEFREAETQRAIANHVAATAGADKKKAAGAGIATPPGSVPRTPPPADTREARDAGMVAMIEAAQRGES